MDLKRLEDKKKKKKKLIPQVRVKEELYNEVKKIAEVENISIIKMTEFFLESAIKEYKKIKD